MTRRKQWPAVEILWADAHGGDPGWITLTATHGKAVPIRTVGMLARETKTGYVVVLSTEESSRTVGAYVFIPKCNVIRKRELTK